MYLYTFI